MREQVEVAPKEMSFLPHIYTVYVVYLVPNMLRDS